MAKRTCTCTESQSDFAYWSALPSLTPETRDAIRKADIVLVPDPGFADYVGPLFPTQSGELFQYLREQAPTDVMVELAVEDADYKELALHADVVTIAKVVVKAGIARVAVSLITDWLKKRLGSFFQSSVVRSTVIVDMSDGEGRRAVQMAYEGPADTFETSLKQVLSSLRVADKVSCIAKDNNPPVDSQGSN